MKSKFMSTGLMFLALMSCYKTAAAAEIDWGKVKGKTIKAFYPGVASWQFMKGKDHGKGGPVMEAQDESCASCHISKKGKYDIDADNIITGKKKMVASGAPLEPEPLAGRKGFIDVDVKAAYDAENIYLRFQWEGSGASVKDLSLVKKEQADKIAVQLNDNMKVFKFYGCFIACHDDQKGMPKDNKKDTKLYGFYTRVKEFGDIKPKDKLDAYLSKGQFIDLWEAYFEGNKVNAVDGYVLDNTKEDKNDISAAGSYEGGKYTVVIKRKLATGEPTDIALKEGKVFNIGIAVFDNKMGGRKHYTSFPVSVGLGAAADIAGEKF